jgi:hypothetical protein
MAVETSYESSECQDWHAYELVPFILLGILGVSAGCSLFLHDIELTFNIGRIRCIFLQAQLLLEQARP